MYVKPWGWMANTGLEQLQGSRTDFARGRWCAPEGETRGCCPDPDAPGVVGLQPVGGPDYEAVGVYLPLEPNTITASQYDRQTRNGRANSPERCCSAVRSASGLRSGAVPFRSIILSFLRRPQHGARSPSGAGTVFLYPRLPGLL